MKKLILCFALASALSLTACGTKSNSGSTDSANSNVRAATKISDSFAIAKLTAGNDAGTVAATPAPSPTAAAAPQSASTSVDTASAAAPAVFGPSDDKMHLVIYKSALDKEFLLSASLIPQDGAPTSSGLNSKIVAFKLYGDRVFMLEASKGHVVTSDLPSTLILAEIPVVSESADRIELDFNKGMRQVFVAGSWYASDSQGNAYNPDDRSSSISVANSFIDSVRMNNNRVEIRQIVQANMQDVNLGALFMGSLQLPIEISSPTFEVRYFLSPYQTNPNFVAKDSAPRDFQHVGFFQTAPMLEEVSGRSSVKVSKWDISKPITYYVSANTPPEYVEAVKEGILYWNKAFGKEIVRAAMAPTGVTAPDPDYNIIQWVPWDNAGFAYADALMDPRTGEVRNAQVYLTSAFAFHSKAQLRRMLRLYRSSMGHAKTTVSDQTPEATVNGKLFGHLGDDYDAEFNPRLLTEAVTPAKRAQTLALYQGISLQFTKPSRLCQYSPNEATVANLEATVMDQGADDAAVLRLSQDYIRTTVAHEVGHTLGLRHNFAGSLASNVTIPERDSLFSEYLLKGTVPDNKRVFSSSVMDYLVFQDDVLASAQVKAGGDALAYDKAAIQWGYNNQSMGDGSPLFCTDTQVGLYADCTPFDSGSSPIASLVSQANTIMQQLPIMVAERYMAAKAPTDPRDTVPLDQVALDPNRTAFNAVTPLYAALQFLSTHVGQDAMQMIAVERKNPVVDGLNSEEVVAQQFDYVKAQIQALGGIESTYFALLPPGRAASSAGLSTNSFGSSGSLADAMKKNLAAYLARKDVKTFVGLDGKGHDFSDKEVEYIQNKASKFFDKVEDNLYAWSGLAFGLTDANLEFEALKSVPSNGISAQLQTALLKTEQTLITAKSGKTMTANVEVSPGIKPQVNVPLYQYSDASRLRMALMLHPHIVSADPSWGEASRQLVTKQLTTDLENSIGMHLSEVTQTSVSSDLFYWLMVQKRIISTASM